MISYDHSTMVNVTDKNTNQVSSYSIGFNSYKEIAVSLDLTLFNNGIRNQVLYISADQDISVVAYQSKSGSMGAYLALPARAYGYQYVTAHYSKSSSNFLGAFAIVPKEDNTTVSLRPISQISFQSKTGDQNTPLNITLQKFEVFYYRKAADFTGTLVSADKPVAVYGNEECAFVPTSSTPCDYIITQYTPIEYLGKTYVLSVSPLRTADRFRVVGAYDNNHVSVPLKSIDTTLQKNQYREFEVTAPNVASVECNQPCLVAQYTRSFNTDSVSADPSLNIVSAIDQFMPSYLIFFTSQSVLNPTQRFIAITILASEIDGLRLDHQPLSNPVWYNITISNGTFSVTSLAVSAGIHLINHISSNVTFGLSQYGYGSDAETYHFTSDVQFYSSFRCKLFYYLIISKPILYC